MKYGKKIYIVSLVILISLSSCMKDQASKRPNQKDIQTLAADALKQQRLLINNPREVNLEDVISIYEASY